MSNPTAEQQCAHTVLAFKIEGGKTLWHCANCFRGFNPSGDTETEQALVLCRAHNEKLLAVARDVSTMDCFYTGSSCKPDCECLAARAGRALYP